MSKKIPQDELKKKKSYQLKQWLKGEVDPYIGLVEMKPQEEPHISELVVESHKKEQQKLFANIYDREHNWVYRGFVRFYKMYSAWTDRSEEIHQFGGKVKWQK